MNRMLGAGVLLALAAVMPAQQAAHDRSRSRQL
jgi:hypothetical protein